MLVLTTGKDSGKRIMLFLQVAVVELVKYLH